MRVDQRLYRLKNKRRRYRLPEYQEARDWIENSFSVDADSADKFNSHFEVTIRILGGLLSGYHLSADEIFLKHAVRFCKPNDIDRSIEFFSLQIELGDRLLLNFNTPTGLPLAEINIKRKVSSGYR